MKCIISRNDLLPVLEHAARVVETRHNIPVLMCVRLEATSAGVLKLEGTDMDMTYRHEILCDTAAATPGAVLLQLKPLHHFVKAAPKGALVEIEARPLEKDTVPGAVIRCSRNVATVNGCALEDWPIGERRPFTDFAMQAHMLLNMLNAVKHAISTEKTRYYLNGVFLYMHKGALVAVASDGRRLGRIQVEAPDAAPLFPKGDQADGVILPAAAVAFLCKWIAKSKDFVAVAVSDDRTRLRFDLGAGQFETKVIDGCFPDYERVTPYNNEIKVELGTAALATFLNGHKRTVLLDCSPGFVHATIADPDAGDQSTALEASVSAAIKIGFNASYLRQELERAGAGLYGSVTLALADACSPALLTSRDRPGEHHVLMPTRV